MKPLNALTLSCRLGAIAVLVGLAACSTASRNWVRPGASDAQRDKDYDVCHSQMRSATKQAYDIDQDITASRGSDWRRMGNYNSQSSQLSQGDADYGAQVLSSCMTDKGYRHI